MINFRPIFPEGFVGFRLKLSSPLSARKVANKAHPDVYTHPKMIWEEDSGPPSKFIRVWPTPDPRSRSMDRVYNGWTGTPKILDNFVEGLKNTRFEHVKSTNSLEFFQKRAFLSMCFYGTTLDMGGAIARRASIELLTLITNLCSFFVF